MLPERRILLRSVAAFIIRGAPAGVRIGVAFGKEKKKIIIEKIYNLHIYIFIYVCACVTIVT